MVRCDKTANQKKKVGKKSKETETTSTQGVKARRIVNEGGFGRTTTEKSNRNNIDMMRKGTREAEGKTISVELFGKEETTLLIENLEESEAKKESAKRKNHPNHRPTGTSEVLTFYPTLEEFKDFTKYIEVIEKTGAQRKAGIAKIVAPEEWSPCKEGYNSTVMELLLQKPLKEKVTIKTDGVFTKDAYDVMDKMRVKDIWEMNRQDDYKAPAEIKNMTPKEFEEYLFNSLDQKEPIYGADNEGTLFDKEVKNFNVSNLKTILGQSKMEISGITSPYLYFGLYKTIFPLHTEDMELYSINYLHFGSEKYWFSILPEAAERFEKLLDQLYSELKEDCSQYNRHKVAILSPKILKKHGIPFTSMIQRPREFIITFPRGYHQGLNLGFNCAEAINFASDRWIDHAKFVEYCKCGLSKKYPIKFGMEGFMETKRHEEFDTWSGFVDRRGLPISTIEHPLFPGPSTKKEAKFDEEHARRQKRYNKSWKKRDSTLSVRSPHADITAEAAINKNEAIRYGCAICAYFKPVNYAVRKEAKDINKIPKKSQRLISGITFAKSQSIQVDPLKDDHILICSLCNIAVHSGCYSGEQKGDEEWFCFRCRDKNMDIIPYRTCNLCELRGGALIPHQFGSDTGAFAHVICALMSRSTVFDRPIGPTKCFTRPPPHYDGQNEQEGFFFDDNYTSDKLSMLRLECNICRIRGEGLLVCALCVETEEPHNRTIVHATCAKESGFLFEEREFPTCAVIVCDRHAFFIDEIETKSKGRERAVKQTDTISALVVQFISGDYCIISPNQVISCSCEGKCKKRHLVGARLTIRSNGINKQCYLRK